ncbi:MAG: 16S rRNA (cytosine(1402)-N(4))-methyltransferase, partial [Xanthomonas perforans]|nr:16S rRNA (cytosine(1402)-N(4))-methyltransferase [Xanthomonas perforans]
SAAEWLAHASDREIADVLWTYGEERQSRRIARAIVARRAEQPLLRTAQLAELIASVMPRGDSKTHPATRSFQAIRIYINRELDDLEAGLDAALGALKP